MKNINILFGSETGNSEDLANKTGTFLTEKGHNIILQSADKINVETLSNMGILLLITSTWGDGEPPSNTTDLYNELQNSSIDLSNLSFAIFAIGSDAFPQFCQAGIDFNQYLLQLKAKSLIDLEINGDDYMNNFTPWLEKINTALS